MFMMMDFMPMLFLHLAIRFGRIGATTLLVGAGILAGDGDLVGDHLGDGGLLGAGAHHGIDQVGGQAGDQDVIDQVGDHHGVATGVDLGIIPTTIIDVHKVALI